MDHTNNEREMASHAIGVLSGEEESSLLSHEQVCKAFQIMLQVQLSPSFFLAHSSHRSFTPFSVWKIST